LPHRVRGSPSAFLGVSRVAFVGGGYLAEFLICVRLMASTLIDAIVLASPADRYRYNESAVSADRVASRRLRESTATKPRVQQQMVGLSGHFQGR